MAPTPVGPAGQLWVLGAHGGAGESVLADLLPRAAAADHQWPGGGHHLVVVVARTDRRGIVAAQLAARQWTSGGAGGVELLGVLWSADAPGKLPKAIRGEMQVVSGGFPRNWHIEWQPEWRESVPTPDKLTRHARGVVAAVEAARQQYTSTAARG